MKICDFQFHHQIVIDHGILQRIDQSLHPRARWRHYTRTRLLKYHFHTDGISQCDIKVMEH